MSDSVNQGSVVLCPFWREWRAHFGVRVCDNLVGGVPSCVASNFYPDDPYAYDNIEDYYNVVICPHFVRSDYYSYVMYSPTCSSKDKPRCFFGGDVCFHNTVSGFGACVGCSRFKSKLVR